MHYPTLPHINLCILIPCYNNFLGLIRSLNSIDYSKDKYVVVIADDGSPQPVTLEDIRKHLPTITKVHVVRLEKNQGITRALNEGLAFIYGHYNTTYIARLDCGDICAPRRFYTQIAFFEQHPEVHLTGTWCYFKNNATGQGYQYSPPTLHKQIRRDMYFRNVFIHPTVMWRNYGAGKLVYPEQYPYAEDYGLFYEMISNMTAAIINECLVTCEINHQGISILNRTAQLKSRLKVVSYYGKNKWLTIMGAIKLHILMLLPYNLILNTKKVLYNTTYE